MLFPLKKVKHKELLKGGHIVAVLHHTPLLYPLCLIFFKHGTAQHHVWCDLPFTVAKSHSSIALSFKKPALDFPFFFLSLSLLSPSLAETGILHLTIASCSFTTHARTRWVNYGGFWLLAKTNILHFATALFHCTTHVRTEWVGYE